MARFSITAARFGPFPTLRLSDSQTGAELVVALRGATLLHWNVLIDGIVRTLSDGHQTPEELDAQSGMRFGLMAPFSNRVADGRYSFDGEHFDLQPGLATAQRGLRHGFLRHADFELSSQHADDESAQLELVSRVLRPGVFAGYPFAVDVGVSLKLTERAVEYRITAVNVGGRVAPFACGLHPYFKLAEDGIEQLELEIPAQTLILTDANLIPLPGDSAYVPVGNLPEFDYHRRRAVAGAVIDCAYTGLKADPDGIIRSCLRDPLSGVAVAVTQMRGLLHAFSTDTVARGKRAAVALEPVELPTNAFNRADCADAVRLQPDETRSFRCGFELLQE